MKSGIGVFGLLLAIGALGFLLLQIPVVSYRQAGLHPAPAPEPEYAAVDLPRVESLRGPHAVLVLDVSGSMRDSDPRRLQAEAVLRFYSTYADLAREILRPGDEARIAIVLFSTVAQVVDWTGTGNPWLKVDAAGQRLVERVVAKYLGGAGADPRAGQKTDYAGALERVGELVGGLETPPAVIFMTDGVNDPDPLFSPVLRREEREAEWPDEYAARRQEIEAAGKGRFVSAVSLDALADPARGARGPKPGPAFLDRASDAVRSLRQRLLSRRYRLSSGGAAVPPVWAPVFLGADTGQSGAAGARSLLADGAEDGEFMLCRDPRDLVGGFIGVLSHWFRLQEVAVPAGSSRVTVSREAQAFAVCLNTQGAGSSFELASGAEVVPLQGRDGVWAGVGRHGGDWSFRTDGGAVTGGRLIIRPRHDWVLHSPSRMVVGAENPTLPLDLHLVSLESGQPVQAGHVYPQLPSSLEARVEFEDGRTTGTTLQRVSKAGEGVPAYSAAVPLGDSLGRAQVDVDLGPLAAAGIPVRAVRLQAEIQVRPDIRLVLTGPAGRIAGIHVEDVPREGAWLRRILSRRGESQ